MRRSRPPHSKKSLLCGVFLALLCLFFAHDAGAQIKQPGAHADYSLEVDPHLVVQHARGPFFDDEGLGLGLRLSIPLVRNGPIDTINNNMGISFGGDIAFFGTDFGCRSRQNGLLGERRNRKHGSVDHSSTDVRQVLPVLRAVLLSNEVLSETKRLKEHQEIARMNASGALETPHPLQ